MFVAFSAVFVLVVLLWLYALFRHRAPQSDERWARRVTNRWIIGGGIALPLSSVIVLLALGLPTGYRMLPVPLEQEPMRIEVIGHQWWWEVRYPETGVITANELYLPAGEPVDFHLNSEDVIHSFWIPRLGGKLDVLPGRTNILRLQADAEGSFRAQCAEFCGWGHAHMILPVEALSRSDFDAWLQQRQQQPRLSQQRSEAAAAFKQHCGDCHRVRGVSEGTSAPDLTSVAARPLLGGQVKREDRPILYWLRNHRQPSHPRTGDAVHRAFPDHREIAPQEAEAIADWLENLDD